MPQVWASRSLYASTRNMKLDKDLGGKNLFIVISFASDAKKEGVIDSLS